MVTVAPVTVPSPPPAEHVVDTTGQGVDETVAALKAGRLWRAGLDVFAQEPAPQDGSSFVPMLERRRTPWRHDYLLEYLGRNALADGGPPPYVAIHTPRYLYVEYHYRHWHELYDLRRDPWELNNVAKDPKYARIERTLAAKLEQLYRAPPHPATDLETIRQA